MLEKLHNQLLDSVPDGVFTVDADWRITFFNRAAEQITGVRQQEALGQRCCGVFRASICETACALKQTLGHPPARGQQGRLYCQRAGRAHPDQHFHFPPPLTDARGKTIGGVESFRDLRLVNELRQQAEQQDSFSDIIGRSAAMRQLFDLLPPVAESDSTVLSKAPAARARNCLPGPSISFRVGTRKSSSLSTVARCRTRLLESELFGYKAGAFTDARKDKPGRFALAEGGTILLDEIGDISPAMQTRLLRVLQERVYEPLGSVEPVRCNVRVIAATNKSLAALVKAGKFREDLF